MGLLYNELASSSGPAYKIAKSVRFNKLPGIATYFTRTPSSAGNRKTWTISMWFKIGGFNTNTGRTFFSTEADSSNWFSLYPGSGNNNNVFSRIGGATFLDLFGATTWRDCASWKHYVLIYDSTEIENADRIKIFEEGIRVTDLVRSTTLANITLDFETIVNSTTPIYIGAGSNTNVVNLIGSVWDGNIAEVVFLDGVKPTTSTKLISGVARQVLTELGEFSPVTGVWEARKWTRSYGTNGYYLNFSDGTSTTTLGYDYSGNNNHFTPVGLVRNAGDANDCWTNDVPPNNGDTNPLLQPSSNYCVLNALDTPDNYKLFNANSTGESITTNHVGNRGTMAYPNTGKWYWEGIVGSNTTAASAVAVGVATRIAPLNTALGGANTAFGVYFVDNISSWRSTTNTWNATGSLTAGDTLQIAYDSANRLLWIGKNNVWYNSTGGTTGSDPATGASPSLDLSPVLDTSTELFPYIQLYLNTLTTNFGQVSFNYTPPTGFTTLCATNISRSAVINGGKFMDATLYTGNSSSQTIGSNYDVYPDLVWVKNRNTGDWHILTDSNTGASKYWSTNALNAQTTGATTFINAISSSGFTVGTAAPVNGSTNSLVAWQWQAGQGVTSTNTAGQVTSTVCVNQDAGFSIISYTGTGTTFGNAGNDYQTSIGHGLNVAPKFYVIKRLDAANFFFNYAYTTGIDGSLDVLNINNNNAKIDSELGIVTNTTITVPFGNNDFGVSGGTYLIYAWAEVPGFSRMGSYVGATIGGSFVLGPFIYTGFRPKFIMIKASSTTGDWVMIDTSRNPYNPNNAAEYFLNANTFNAETTTSPVIDIVANGFKLRDNGANYNTNGVTYFYMAFAENPFAQANSR